VGRELASLPSLQKGTSLNTEALDRGSLFDEGRCLALRGGAVREGVEGVGLGPQRRRLGPPRIRGAPDPPPFPQGSTTFGEAARRLASSSFASCATTSQRPAAEALSRAVASAPSRSWPPPSKRPALSSLDRDSRTCASVRGPPSSSASLKFSGISVE